MLTHRFMAWTVPRYSKNQVNLAGKVLIDPPVPQREDNSDWTQEDWDLWSKYDEALTVINNWRSSHSYPLNTFQMTLRRRALHIDGDSVVSQRIKRLAAIKLKLRNEPNMALSQMQDIGGCRAVVKSVRNVRRLTKLYENESKNWKHRLRRVRDYIEYPRHSGYRGVHLVYHHYRKEGSPWDGLQIEMQIRSQLQHAWATAVETVGTFLRQALKSSHGDEPWLQFFALMGSAMALKEKTPIVPNTPVLKKDLIGELRAAVTTLDVEGKLTAYGHALREVGNPAAKGAKYFLLNLDASARQLTIKAYTAGELNDATEEYLKAEREISSHPAAEAVLVSVQSLTALKRAYPSYFLETGRFLEAVREAARL